MIELVLMYHPSGWAVFERNHRRENGKITGMPSEVYRIYEVAAENRDKIKRALVIRAVHLQDQKITPSAANYKKIFLDLAQLLPS
jgi:hypothetical protein